MKYNLETLMAAIAFAEENQHDTALQILHPEKYIHRENNMRKDLPRKKIKKQIENRPTLSV